MFEALGALQVLPRATGAGSSGRSGPRTSWSNGAAACGRSRRRPTDRARSCSSRDGEPAGTAGAPAPTPATRPQSRAATRVVLGLDLGSTGSKGVLVEPRSGAVLADVYRRTDGNPVEAAKRLVSDLRAARPRDKVVAVGLTGSGRDAVATVMRAAYPGLDGAADRAERDRGPRRRRRALRRRRRPQPVDRRDRRPGRQVHQRARRARARVRHEPRLQRRHGLVPRRAGAGPRARRHRRVRRPGGALPEPARPRPDLHRVRCRRRRRGAGRRLQPQRHLRRAAVLGDQELHRPRDGRPPLLRARLLSGQTGQQPLAGAHAGRGHRTRGRGAAEPGRHGGAGDRPARGRGGMRRRTALDAAAGGAPIDLDVFASARVVERKSGRCGDRTAPTSAGSRPRRRGGRRAPPRGERRQLPQVRRALRGGRQAAQGRAQPVPRARRAAGRRCWASRRGPMRRPARWPAAASACRRRTT